MNGEMNSQEALDWLAQREFFGIKLGLDQTRELFARLGNPERQLRFIHVAGSNGKGSVCAFLESALRKVGYRTGFYSSPHLVDVTERFQIDGHPCKEEQLVRLILRVIPHAEAMAEEGKAVTYFEVLTVIAAMLFSEEHVDFVLWETGMGGRLDSTSVVTPEACAITGISLEHCERLGSTLAAIAGEKAGIIKPHIPIFCARSTPKDALDVIVQKANELHAPFVFSAELDPAPPVITVANDFSHAMQTCRLHNGTPFKISLMGNHQCRNAALAYVVLAHLATKYHFSLETALTGFADTRWDARFQFLPERHLLIDAAHNPEGVEVLTDVLKSIFPGERFHFIFGAFSDKDVEHSLLLLAPLAASFRFVALHSERQSRTPAELVSMLLKIAPEIPSMASTLAEALSTSRSDHWNILCGSLHLCGEALGIFRADK